MDKKKIVKSFGMILLYMILINLEGIVFYFIKTGSTIKDNILLIFLASITFSIVLFLSRKNLSGEINKFKENHKQYMLLALKYWIYGFIYMFISNIIISIVILKGIAPNEAANRELLNTYRYYSLISTAILAPIMEEIIFRLNFKNIFKTKDTFIIFTGILFGAMHIISSSSWLEVLYIIPYSCLGIAFSKIYAETNNIVPSIITHMIHNTLTLLIILGGI